MSTANVKIQTSDIKEIKKYTGESTGQKAVQKALLYFLKEARQRQILDVLGSIKFKKGFDPMKLRQNER